MEKQYPLISVITVSYNAVSTIEDTILSVINQTYSNIEYIIIDGGSTDGTVDIIKKYQEKISFWVSEPDKGIYDAMNKGINHSTGMWINFMNSGDLFYHNNVLLDLLIRISDISTNIVYGDTMVRYSWGNVMKPAFTLSVINHEMPFCHQSCLISSSLMKEHLYNLRYKICADYYFFFKCYQEGVKFTYIEMVVSVYESENGVSSANVLTTLRELAQINGEERLWKWKFNFFFFHIRLCFHKLLNMIVPVKLLIFYRQKKYNAIDSFDYEKY